MDQDTLELARLLCCRVGMLMEDASVLGVTAPINETKLRKTLFELGVAVDQMRALVDAAKALLA